MLECVFCKIVAKQAHASLIYDDGQVTAFLSNHPVNVGHTLVVPKKHYETIYEMPEKEVAYLFTIVKKVAYAVKKATSTDGIRLVQNNGGDAGQIVFHIHVHVIPMKPPDHVFHEHSFRTPELLDQDAEKIKRMF